VGFSWREDLAQGLLEDLKVMNSFLIERCRKMGTTKESIKRYFQLADIGMTGVKRENVYFADETYVDLHPARESK